MTTVFNLSTGEKRTYSLCPRAAVIAAYAQGKHGDYDTTNYAMRYGHLPQEGTYGWHIGDYSAPKQQASIIR